MTVDFAEYTNLAVLGRQGPEYVALYYAEVELCNTEKCLDHKVEVEGENSFGKGGLVVQFEADGR